MGVAVRLRSRLRTGIAWSAVHLVATRGLAMFMRIVLAGVLMPEHFGLFAMAALGLGLISTVADLGLPGALMQRRGLGKQVRATAVFWVLAVAGLAWGAGAAVLGAPALAVFYGEPDLLGPTQALCLVLVFNLLAAVPVALLTRQMRLGSLVLAEFAGAAVGALAAVAFALDGQGVWALVAQQVLGAALTMLVAWRLCRWLPAMGVDVASLLQMWPFARAMASTRLVMFLRSNLDTLFIGAWLGAVPLGLYTLAYTYTEGVRTQVAGAAARVVLPLFSQSQGDLPAVRSHYLRATRVMLVAIAPLSLLALLYADELCQGMLGPTWGDAASPMRMLALAGLAHAVGGPAVEVLQGLGRARQLLGIATRNALFLALPLMALLTWSHGTFGAACALTLAVVAQRIALHRALSEAIGVGVGELWRASAPPLALGALLIAVAWAARGTVPPLLEGALLVLAWILAGRKLVGH